MNFKLAATNLLISQFCIFILLIFAYYVWFPHSLSEFIGFEEKARLIIIVNLILGPILFLIVYKKHKKSLKFDILCLLILQMLAIAYGVYALYQKHPNYAVFTVDRFTLINPANTEPNKIKFHELKTSLFSKPIFVVAKLPRTIEERNELALSSITGKDLDTRHEYFEPYMNHINSIVKKSIDTDMLFSSESTMVKLRSFLDKHTGAKDDYLYLPLQSATKDVVWVLDKKNALPVGIIDIDPWLYL